MNVVKYKLSKKQKLINSNPNGIYYFDLVNLLQKPKTGKIKEKIRRTNMGLTGKKAPDFTASAVINGNQIVDDFKLSNLSILI